MTTTSIIAACLFTVIGWFSLPQFLAAQAFDAEPVFFLRSMRGPIRSVEVSEIYLWRNGSPAKRKVPIVTRVWLNRHGDVERWGYDSDTSSRFTTFLYDNAGCKKEEVLVSRIPFVNRSTPGRIIIERSRYTYDSFGMPITIMRYVLPGDSLFATFNLTYDSLRRIMSIRSVQSAPGRKRDTTEYAYGYSSGGEVRIHSESRYDDSSNEAFTKELDAGGHLVRSTLHGADSGGVLQLQRIVEYRNDSLGNPLMEVRRWKTSRPDTLKYAYEYDRNGNWITRRTYRRHTVGWHDPSSLSPFAVDAIIRRRIEYYSQSEIVKSRCTCIPIEVYD